VISKINDMETFHDEKMKHRRISATCQTCGTPVRVGWTYCLTCRRQRYRAASLKGWRTRKARQRMRA
jgi:hypothetical protein